MSETAASSFSDDYELAHLRAELKEILLRLTRPTPDRMRVKIDTINLIEQLQLDAKKVRPPLSNLEKYDRSGHLLALAQELVADYLRDFDAGDLDGAFPQNDNGNCAAASVPQILGIKASEAEDRDNEWISKPYIERGSICEIIGDSDVGKGFISVDLIAHMTTGLTFLDAAGPTLKGPVCFLSVEQKTWDTKAKLRAAHADLDLVRILPATLKRRDGTDSVVTFPEDLPPIAATIKADGAIALFLDPLSAFIGERTNTHNDSSLRRVLGELFVMADRLNCAIISIRHLNKDSSQGKAIYRGSGSAAFTAATRCSFLVGIDPTDKAPRGAQRRIFTCIRVSNEIPPPSRAFRIERLNEDRAAHVEWIEEKCAFLPDDLLRAHRERTADAMEKAESFLRDELKDGAVLQHKIEERAELLKLSMKTIYRAKKALGVRSERKDYSGLWWWSLPNLKNGRRLADYDDAIDTEAPGTAEDDREGHWQ